LVSGPPLPEEGPIQADPAFAASEAPEADEGQDGDDAEISQEDSDSTSSPPPANSEEKSLEKKRKRLDNLLSLSSSILKDAPGEPSAAKTILRCLTLWTREFCYHFILKLFYL
jgi:hypothetical protein